MKTPWDIRYDTVDFVYGKQANGFFAAELEKLRAGSLLLPGEGEGRNAVHAATKGWEVEAFDQSHVAAKKALVYAAEKGVQLEYSVAGIDEFSFQPNQYDAVGLVYVHSVPSDRILLHQQVVRALKPEGTVILEAFHTSQLGNNSGGPPSLEYLFSEEIIRSDFAGLEIGTLEQVRVHLEEGSFHQGDAELIRFVGRKLNK